MTRRLPAPSALDKLVGWISPAEGLRRQVARVRLAALTGGYHGGGRDRRALRTWRPRELDADEAVLPDLPYLRSRTRDLARNSALAPAVQNRLVTAIVGPGLRLVPEIDSEVLGLDDEAAADWQRRAALEWQLWAASPSADASGVDNFDALQAGLLRAVIEGGDCFVLLAQRQQARPYRLALQTYEAEQVSNPDNKRDGAEANGVRLVGGIELSSAGEHLAVHIAQLEGQGLTRKAVRWSRVPLYGEASGLRQVLHIFARLRLNQTRGVPLLAPLLEPLRQLTVYSDSELMAAVLSSMIAIVHKGRSGEPLANPDPTVDSGPTSAGREFTIEPGTVLDLPFDDEVEVPQLGRPNAEFDPFFLSLVRQLGAALEIPFEVLLLNFNASYSASRAALEAFFQMVRARRAWFAQQLCQPVYEALLTEAVARGRLAAPGFFTDPLVRQAWCGARWIGPARPVIDPLRENNAAGVALDRGFTTLADQVAEKSGADWRRVHRQRAREVAERRRDGLEGGTAPAAAPPAPVPPPSRVDAPEDEET